MNKENPYVIISHQLIIDARISPECRWLLMYIISTKDSWKINLKQLCNHCKEFMGRDRIYKIVKEAMEFGYLTKKKSFGKIEYFLSEFAKV